ncbi:hypothetical protein ACJX0J_003696 (mitochondrion) [Zea mays]
MQAQSSISRAYLYFILFLRRTIAIAPVIPLLKMNETFLAQKNGFFLFYKPTKTEIAQIQSKESIHAIIDRYILYIMLEGAKSIGAGAELSHVAPQKMRI